MEWEKMQTGVLWIVDSQMIVSVETTTVAIMKVQIHVHRTVARMWQLVLQTYTTTT